MDFREKSAGLTYTFSGDACVRGFCDICQIRSRVFSYPSLAHCAPEEYAQRGKSAVDRGYGNVRKLLGSFIDLQNFR